MNEYFGEPRPSGICDDGVRVATPVGEACIYCDEAIEEDHQGSFMSTETGGRPVHKECALRMVVGGIAHVMKWPSCPCRGGNDPDGGYSPRTSALLVWEWVQKHGVPAA